MDDLALSDFYSSRIQSYNNNNNNNHNNGDNNNPHNHHTDDRHLNNNQSPSIPRSNNHAQNNAQDEDDMINIPQHFDSILKPHQKIGVRFLYSHMVEDEQKEQGCILADYMGLGKSLQVLVSLYLYLSAYRDSHEHPSTLPCILILAPATVVNNWKAEIQKWFGGRPDDISLMRSYVLNSTHTYFKKRIQVINDWYKSGGICVTSYELFRSIASISDMDTRLKPHITSAQSAKKNTKHSGLNSDSELSSDSEEHSSHTHNNTTSRGLEIDNSPPSSHLHGNIYTFRHALCKPGPDILICDEAHRLKGGIDTLTYRVLDQIHTRKRILLTGYPVQNRLAEYWWMTKYVAPHILPDKQIFKDQFETPIDAGMHRDSSIEAIELSKKRIYVLQQQLNHIMLRRNGDILTSSLPPRYEYVIFCALSPLQHRLYRKFLEWRHIHSQKNSNRTTSSSCNYVNADTLSAYNDLKLLINHPHILKQHILEQTRRRDIVEYMEAHNIHNQDNNVHNSRNNEDNNSCQFETSSDLANHPYAWAYEDLFCDNNTKAKGDEHMYESDNPDYRNGDTDTYTTNNNTTEDSDIHLSGKTLALFTLLDKFRSLGDRTLIFSRSIPTLDYIQQMLLRRTRPALYSPLYPNNNGNSNTTGIQIENSKVQMKSMSNVHHTSNHLKKLEEQEEDVIIIDDSEEEQGGGDDIEDLPVTYTPISTYTNKKHYHNNVEQPTSRTQPNHTKSSRKRIRIEDNSADEYESNVNGDNRLHNDVQDFYHTHSNTSSLGNNQSDNNNQEPFEYEYEDITVENENEIDSDSEESLDDKLDEELEHSSQPSRHSPIFSHTTISHHNIPAIVKHENDSETIDMTAQLEKPRKRLRVLGDWLQPTLSNNNNRGTSRFQVRSHSNDSTHNTTGTNSDRWHVYRLDGRTPGADRTRMIQEFNNPSTDVDVFLISTKAGGEGITLTGANRVIIFDVSFNPCTDGQAARRCYRYGQQKHVYVYRLVASDTLEHVVFNRQIVRQGLSSRVIDATPVLRIFNKHDLQDLFDDTKLVQQQVPNHNNIDTAYSHHSGGGKAHTNLLTFQRKDNDTRSGGISHNKLITRMDSSTDMEILDVTDILHTDSSNGNNNEASSTSLAECILESEVDMSPDAALHHLIHTCNSSVAAPVTKDVNFCYNNVEVVQTWKPVLGWKSYDLLLAEDLDDQLDQTKQKEAMAEFSRTNQTRGKRGQTVSVDNSKRKVIFVNGRYITVKSKVTPFSSPSYHPPVHPALRGRPPRVQPIDIAKRTGTGIFQTSTVCLVPDGIFDKQKSILNKRIRDKGGIVTSTVRPDTTHIVSNLSATELALWVKNNSRLTSTPGSHLVPPDTSMHRIDWVTNCLTQNRLLDKSQCTIAGAGTEIQRVETQLLGQSPPAGGPTSTSTSTSRLLHASFGMPAASAIGSASSTATATASVSVPLPSSNSVRKRVLPLFIQSKHSHQKRPGAKIS